MNEARLLTLANWHAAYAAGASADDLLHRRLRRLMLQSPPALWIALADASALDAQLVALARLAAAYPNREAAQRALPLYGVPFAVKDNIDVAGFETTAACAAFAYRPARSAAVVARLVEAGAVCLGKTNLDQFATGLAGTRSPYGRPASAFAADRVSGGSSAGSAVAVARGDVAFALGTDTAGSGRVPAGFNQVVGLKPTPGRIGASGVVPACRSIDCVSILALTASDAAHVLALTEGPDAADPYSDFRTGPAHFAPRLRIGIPAAPVFTGDAAYGAAFECAVAHLQSLGHDVVPLDFAPLDAVASLLYQGPWLAERHAVVQALLERDPSAFDPTVRAVIEAARSYSATDAFRGLYRLREARQTSHALWSTHDLLMVPSAPGHPTHAEIDADPRGANAALGRYTNFVNLLGWSAIAMPAGTAAHGLPFGVTFIAPGASDAALARFGCEWQASLALPLGATGVPFTDASGTAAQVASPHPGERSQAPAWPASEATLPIAVVGSHLSGLPLNGQLVERGAQLVAITRTAPAYRLYALPGTVPPKPGLLRAVEGGAAIELEVWEMPIEAVGSFLALVPPPLGIGSIELADGSTVHGFVCEAHALAGAEDITSFGGWRAWLARR